MSRTHLWAWAVVVCLFSVPMVCAQSQPASDGSSGPSSVAAVPRLIKFNGAVRDAGGEPLGSIAVRLTFAVYSEQQGGAALWAETQMVQLDEQGHYTVLLGATRADGLPVELFPAGKARWLGVQVEGRDEDLRVLLVSVPYALKAEDAAMLGGRRASDFVLAEQLKEEVKAQVEAQKPGIATQAVEMLVSNPPKAPAIAEGPSTFTCATTGNCVTVQQNGTGRAMSTSAVSSTDVVLVQQTGTGYGLRALSPGNVALFGQVTGSAGTSYGVKGLTTSTTGAGVYGYNLAATSSAYGVLGQTKSTAGVAVFGRALAATGNTVGVLGAADSPNGVGVMGRMTRDSGPTTGVQAKVSSPDGTALVADNTAGGKLVSAQVNGVEKFSVSSTGSVSSSGSVTAGSFVGDGAGLTDVIAKDLNCTLCITPPHLSFNYAGSSSQGGPATAALAADTATNALSLAGTDAAKYARQDSANTFMETQTFSGNLNLPATASSGLGVTNTGGSRSVHAYQSDGTVGVINLGNLPFIHAYGTGNTFIGRSAGNFSMSGGANTATGYQALNSNTTGPENTANGSFALNGNTTGYDNTAMGAYSLYANTTGNYNTAIGYRSGQFNTTGSENTFIGYSAGPLSGNGGLSNATAIGARAVVSQSNSLILGGTSTWAVNVGIGVSAPVDRLQVVGDIRVGTSGTNGCVKRFDGTAIAGSCSSDARLKTDVQTFQPVLNQLAQLAPVHFYWKADEFPEMHFGRDRSYGLIAQEVEKVFPEMVGQDERGYKTVDYTRLPLLLLEAVRELKAGNDHLLQRIAEQQAQIHTLKSEIERLSARLEGGVETASR